MGSCSIELSGSVLNVKYLTAFNCKEFSLLVSEKRQRGNCGYFLLIQGKGGWEKGMKMLV